MKHPREVAARRGGLAPWLGAALVAAALSAPTIAGASAPALVHTAATRSVTAAQSGQAQMKTIACATSTECLAIGASSTDQGVISYSNTAGYTWSPVRVFDPSTILSLNALTCPSSTECVAVGASLEHRGVAVVGRLVGGLWVWSTPVAMDNESGARNVPTVSLNSVACVSATVCVAVGTDLSNAINVSTYTTNAGSTWTADAVVAGDGVTVGNTRAELNSISCNSATTCVAVGADAAGYAEVTNATFAGGVWSWNASATQLPGDGQGGDLNAVSCFNPTTCVAVGSDNASSPVTSVATLASSTWSWSPESVVVSDPSGAGGLFTLTCASTGACLALGVDHAAQTVVTRSSAGALAWGAETAIANDGATSAAGGNDPAGVACASATRCLAVGTDALGRSFVTASSDAGTTWSREALFDVAALPGEGPLSSVSCSGALCVAVGTNNASQSVVSRSTDSGRSWGPERLLRNDGTGASYIQGVDCVQSLCVAVGWDNLSQPVYTRSVNGGVSWSTEKRIGIDFSSVGFLNHVACPNRNRCVAVGWDGRGQAVTTYSLDGGATWVAERTVSADATGSGFLYAVSCPRPTYCVAVGRDDQFKGVAAYSANGGVGWRSMTALTSVTAGTGALSDISCPRVTLCVAVGGTGTGAGASVVARSTNGGVTWTPESTVALDSTRFGLLSSVGCLSATLCVASGTDGFEHAVTTSSTNGGVSWSREATTLSVNHRDFLTGLSCSSAVKCVAVGADSAQRGVVVPIRLPATVTFAAHGGRGAMSPQVAWSAQHLHAVHFVRPGYRFVGWTRHPGAVVAFKNRGTYNFLANLTLYAVWQRR